MPENVETLKNCPFCDGDPIEEKDDTYPDRITYWVRCRSCAAQGGWSKNPVGARRHWNMRMGAGKKDA